MIKTVIEEEPIGKIPLDRPRLKWEDCVKREVMVVHPGANWREVADDRERWREMCCTSRTTHLDSWKPASKKILILMMSQYYKYQ